jgi:hypothetical protein
MKIQDITFECYVPSTWTKEQITASIEKDYCYAILSIIGPRVVFNVFQPFSERVDWQQEVLNKRAKRLGV